MSAALTPGQIDMLEDAALLTQFGVQVTIVAVDKEAGADLISRLPQFGGNPRLAFAITPIVAEFDASRTSEIWCPLAVEAWLDTARKRLDDKATHLLRLNRRTH